MEPLNKALVSEFYKMLYGFHLQQMKFTPQDFESVASLLSVFGGVYQAGNSPDISYRFWKNGTTAQIEAMRNSVTFASITNAMGMPNTLDWNTVYDDKQYVLPTRVYDTGVLASVIGVHIWAALLALNMDKDVFVLIARLPDQDYTLPTLGFLRYPSCVPFELSEGALKEAVPDQFQSYETGLLSMTPREMLMYPMFDSLEVR